ncbi:uncharacterized protein MONBRDRAFT_29504 [Monosiga brevicollis MX1]|uniref:BRCT domain-containing protein n=1 Tax=Monosiga brevicollis TaxID=81824 RepID=A9VBA1_MONBE|nr:uncharacterized protein MONBRDRAFT_29504 [Monosiga brevicollis MX1]EDQ85201.1 predicted protein [Monosiga brevicollis MX1]|eukprot:XP_001750026.1 hypothetical protein [Monosiga brevicollis MX1]
MPSSKRPSALLAPDASSFAASAMVSVHARKSEREFECVCVCVGESLRERERDEKKQQKKINFQLTGTMYLVTGVIGSGITAVRLSPDNLGVALIANTIGTVCMLYSVISALIDHSGAHINPAVTLVLKLCSPACPLSWFGVCAYMVSQVAGAFGGIVVAHFMNQEWPVLSRKTMPGVGIYQIYAELMATAGLMTLVLLTPKARIASTVAMYIASGLWYLPTASYCNPAATLARGYSDSFAGVNRVDVPAYLLGQFSGLLLVVVLYHLIQRAYRTLGKAVVPAIPIQSATPSAALKRATTTVTLSGTVLAIVCFHLLKRYMKDPEHLEVANLPKDDELTSGQARLIVVIHHNNDSAGVSKRSIALNDLRRDSKKAKREADTSGESGDDVPAQAAQPAVATADTTVSRIRKPRVAFTSIPSNDRRRFEHIVWTLGGEVVSAEESTHLVVGAPSRTANFLKALCVSDHILEVSWLEDCNASYKFLEESSYAVHDDRLEAEFEFSLATSLERQRHVGKSAVFRDMIFYITPSVVPTHTTLQEIVQAGGGNAVVCTTPVETKAWLSDAQGHDTDLSPIVSRHHVELILSGAAQQHVDFAKWRLHLPSQK